MPEIEFTLRLNSPAFLGSASGLEPGNDPGRRVYPEDAAFLRVPALRGVLGFWYRSLLGGLATSEEVYARYERIFGSTQVGQGLCLRQVRRSNAEWKVLRFVQQPEPFLYLGYGPLQIDQRANGTVVSSSHRDAHRTAVDVPAVDRRPELGYRAAGTAEQIDALQRSLLLLHLFGGVGGRSRRAWGSVAVEGAGVPEPEPEENTADYFGRCLALAWAGFDLSLANSRPRFSAFWTGTKIGFDPRAQVSYLGVHRGFYRRFKATRLYRVPEAERGAIAAEDHELEVQHATEPRGRALQELPRRLAYGLPFQPGHGREWGVTYGHTSPNYPSRELRTRRASPLLLKAFQRDRQLHPVALCLDAEFLGDSKARIQARVIDQENKEKRVIWRSKRGSTSPPESYSAIHEFFDPQWRTFDLADLLAG